MPALCYSSNYHSGIRDQGVQSSRVKMTLTALNSPPNKLLIRVQNFCSMDITIR